MPTAYTSLLGLALPVTGELQGTWGTTVNDAITSLLDTAVAGTTTLNTDADVTLTTTTGASNQARQAIILWTANGSVTRNITAPAQSKAYIVINNSAGTQSIVFRGVGPTTGVTIIKGERAVVAWNGSDFVKVGVFNGALTVSDLTDSSLTSGRVTYATTGGNLTDSANLTFNGTTLTANALSLTTALSVPNGGTGLTSGTSGGLPYFNATNTLASSGLLAANALMVGGGAGAAPSTVTTGTGVVTALGVNTGTAGSFVVNGGALGTPSSGTVTNLTGTASININGTVGATTPNTGAFTSVVSTNAAGILTRAAATQDGVELIGRAGGTSSFKVTFTPTTLSASRTLTLPDNSGTLLTTGAAVTVPQGGTGLTSGTSGGLPYFNATNTMASSGLLAANALMVGGGAGASPSTITTGTGVTTALGVNTGTAGAFVVNGGALGTPSSGTVTNLTGTASININGTVGATTPNTGAFTSVVSTSASGVLNRAAATQDGIALVGRAGGTSSWSVSLTPTTLSASRTATFPDSNTTIPIATQQLTFSGPTAARTITFPDANITVARTDAANTFTGTQTFGGSVVPATLTTDSVGYTGTPLNEQSAAYTLVAADAGKSVVHPASDNNARTFTIPANGTVAFPVGTTITFINMINTVTISITTDTMYLAGAGTTGSRTLAAYGMATAVKMTSTTWIISGNGLT